MENINVIVVDGNLTRDAEMKYTPGGLAIVRFGLAVNRRTKKNDAWTDYANFFDVQYIGKGAEAIHKYLLKGKPVAISGNLRQDRWEKDGEKNSRVYIQAERVRLLNAAPKQQSQAEESPEFTDDIPY